MVTWEKSVGDIKTRYTVEVVNSKKDWDYICKGVFDHGEPWERYKKQQYDNIDKALTTYLCCFFSDNVYDVKLFEEIIVNGETVRECFIEPIPTAMHSFKTFINKSMIDEIDKLRAINKYNQDMLSRYDAFVKEYSGQDLFKKFCESLCNTHEN